MLIPHFTSGTVSLGWSKLVKERASRVDAVIGDIEGKVKKGIHRSEMKKPDIIIIYKNISIESTKDEEFTGALHRALPPAEQQEEWFETFSVVRQRESSDRIGQSLKP